MLERLEARGRALGERAVARVRRAVIERAGDVPGVGAEEVAAGVVLSGRGLRARAFADPRLRWIAGWLR